MDILIKRFISTDLGAFGTMVFNGAEYFTVEKPWVNNTPEISCIPSGNYILEPHQSNKYGNVLCMVNEDKGVTHFKDPSSSRFACLIHTANYERDVIGCIGLGDKYLGNMVTNSRKCIADFYTLVDPTKVHNLTVEWGERYGMV